MNGKGQVMKFRASAVIFLLVVVSSVTGCNFPAGAFPQVIATSAPAAYATVAAILTQTAAVDLAPSPTEQHLPNATPGPSPTVTVATPSPVGSKLPVPSQTSTQICDLAQAGVPIDVTVPDDSRLRPGESFSKTWRLRNGGTCRWTKEYAVVWFSGDDIGVRREEPINVVVVPGDTVDLSVDMVAPEKPGVYQSNWKLRNASGNLFGIGPGGGAPFWVRFYVEALDTPTATVLPPTMTPTVAVAFSGSANLKVGHGINLDAGHLDAGVEDDFEFSKNQNVLLLSPVNNASIVLHGAGAPSLADCQAASRSTEPVVIGPELAGSYLCVQTSRGLPASLQLVNIDPATDALDINFTVWSVP
jgi:hypothetical protein